MARTVEVSWTPTSGIEAHVRAWWASKKPQPQRNPAQVQKGDIQPAAARMHGRYLFSFLYDLADYCRRFMLSEPSMTEVNDTADLILAGGDEALRAARAIAAAMPLAMSRNIARRLSGSVELIGSHPALRVTVDPVLLHFVLFGGVNPWAGVTDKNRVSQLRGAITWGTPERLWPRWSYLRKVGEHGRALVEAASFEDPAAIAELIPIVARALIGSQPIPQL